MTGWQRQTQIQRLRDRRILHRNEKCTGRYEGGERAREKETDNETERGGWGSYRMGRMGKMKQGDRLRQRFISSHAV